MDIQELLLHYLDSIQREQQLSFGCELRRLQYFFINEGTRMENQALLLPESKMISLPSEDQ